MRPSCLTVGPTPTSSLGVRDLASMWYLVLFTLPCQSPPTRAHTHVGGVYTTQLNLREASREGGG